MIKYLFIYMFWKMVLILLTACVCIELNIQDANVINNNEGWLVFIAGCLTHYACSND